MAPHVFRYFSLSLQAYITTLIGVTSAQVGVSILLVFENSLFWLACLIFIISNSLYGAIWVFSYSWVPLLTRFNPNVIEAYSNPKLTDDQRYDVSEREANLFSSKGFMYGYISAVIQLVISCAFVYVVDDGRKWGLTETYPMQICIALICLVQVAGLLAFTLPRLKSRPGPPPPNGKGYISLSFSNRKSLSLYTNFNSLRNIITCPKAFGIIQILAWMVHL